MTVVAGPNACWINNLVRVLSITVGGATRPFTETYAEGPCERRVDPGDAPSTIMFLTTRGRSYMKRGRPVVDAVFREYSSVLDWAARRGFDATTCLLRTSCTSRSRLFKDVRRSTQQRRR
jgi:hypothetical protein